MLTRIVYEVELRQTGEWIADVLDGLTRAPERNGAIEEATLAKVRTLTARFPIYPLELSGAI